ncbi:hypothetical protein D3C84_969570 [compost metagenome]
MLGLHNTVDIDSVKPNRFFELLCQVPGYYHARVQFRAQAGVVPQPLWTIVDVVAIAQEQVVEQSIQRLDVRCSQQRCRPRMRRRTGQVVQAKAAMVALVNFVRQALQINLVALVEFTEPLGGLRRQQVGAQLVDQTLA